MGLNLEQKKQETHFVVMKLTSYFSVSSESVVKKRLPEVRQLYGLMQIIHRTSNDQDRNRVINIGLDFDGTIWWLIFSLFFFFLK